MMKAPRAFGRFSFDPYAAFFMTLAGGFMSVMVAVAAMAMMKDSTPTEFAIMYPLSTLLAVGIMMNLGDQNPSGKEVFCGWILAMIFFAIAAAIGFGILFLFGAFG